MLTLVLKENEQSQAHIFQDTDVESSQIHQVTMMYYFEYKNQNVLLNILFQNFDKNFLPARNLHQGCLQK